MAEPLTSSDIWRIQRGFGVSELASPEEKKRFAAAGVAPLTTGARQRFEKGRGISPMAGDAEKEAWIAAEVLAGQRDPMELPKAYGGLGERPEASTRRGLRMQQEWDAQYKMILDQQEAARLAEKEQRNFALNERNQILQERQEARLQAAEAKAQNEALKIADDADRAMAEILGTAVDSAGNPIASLDPDSEDYTERRADILKRYKRAANDDAFKLTLSDLDKKYFDRINFDQSIQASEAQQKSSLAKELAAAGKSIVDFTENGKIDFEKANTALGEAIKEGREREAVKVDEREQRRNLLRQKASAETELVKIKAQVGRFQNLTPTEQNRKELNAALVSQGIFEDEINRINREIGGGETPQPEQPKELSPRDQSALDWANANPDDPRSQRIKQRLGVE